MPLPKSLDWRESAQHIEALSKFLKPREAAQVAGWQYLAQALGEKPALAIERFIVDGALVPCDIAQSLECLCNASDLKKALKGLGQKQSGTKDELIERLVNADAVLAAKLVAGRKVLRCSDAAVAFIDQWQKSRESAIELAQQQCCDALAAGDIAGALHHRTECFRRYPRENEYIGDVSYLAESVSDILNAKPDALADLSEGDLITLRMAVAMKELWGNNAATWIPEEYTCPIDLARALSYIERAADISRTLRRVFGYAQKVELEFNEFDVESCPRCKTLSGKTFTAKDFPHLPLKGCTSTTGCKCDVRVAEGFASHMVLAAGDDGADEGDGGDASVTWAPQSMSELQPGTSEQLAQIDAWIVQLSPSAVDAIHRLVQYMCELEGIEMQDPDEQ
jgi:hypothetical protein